MFLFGHCRIYCYYSLTNEMTLLKRMKNLTTWVSRQFWWQLMACSTSSLGLDYRQGKFIQSLKDIFTRKTLMWHGKTFWWQNLHYGLIHLRALKKVVYCFRSKKHLKQVVILCATCLALKTQWPTLVSLIPVTLNNRKVIEDCVKIFLRGLDQCKIHARNDIKAVLPWDGGRGRVGLRPRTSKIRRIGSFQPMVSSNIIALKRAINAFVESLIDPFFVDCIVRDKDTTHYSTSRFHDIHDIHGHLCWFYVCCL